MGEARATELYQRLATINQAMAKESIELHAGGMDPSDAGYAPVFGRFGLDKAIISVFANDQALSMMRVVVQLLDTGAEIGPAISGPLAAMWLDGWANGYQYRVDHPPAE